MGKYSVPALEKAIAILELISHSKEKLTATEIGTQLELPKATVFTTLSTLEAHNIVTKDQVGKYHIGPKLFQLGMAYASDNSFVELSKPYLKKLMKQTGFTVHLGVLHEDQVMYVAKMEPDSFIKFSTYPGLKTDLHISSLGKAIAAYLSGEELDRIIRKSGMSEHTPKTITTKEAFMKTLDFVRENGYALEEEEGEIGVRCIGAPIINTRFTTPAAISVTAHISQLPPERYKTVGEMVRSVAQEIASII